MPTTCRYRKLHPARIVLRNPESCHHSPHAGDGQTAVALAGLVGEVKTPAQNRESCSPPSVEHSAPAGIAAHAAVQCGSAGIRLALSPLSKLVDAVAIIRPETVIRWHRQGFRAFWRWKSRCRGGRPTIPKEIRDLIREISRANIPPSTVELAKERPAVEGGIGCRPALCISS
jgi:hypothetical protein